MSRLNFFFSLETKLKEFCRIMLNLQKCIISIWKNNTQNFTELKIGN